jgi:hypothetical protein
VASDQTRRVDFCPATIGFPAVVSEIVEVCVEGIVTGTIG